MNRVRLSLISLFLFVSLPAEAAAQLAPDQADTARFHFGPVGLTPRQGTPVPTAGPPTRVPAPVATTGPITPASWNKPSETAPPPELPAEPVPVKPPVTKPR